MLVRGVAARNPRHPGRWAKALKQTDEVGVLRHDDRVGFARCAIDLVVFRVAQTEVTYSTRLDAKTLCNPRRERRRQLGIDQIFK